MRHPALTCFALTSLVATACATDPAASSTGGKADGTGDCGQLASGLYTSTGDNGIPKGVMRAVLNYDCDVVLDADYQLTENLLTFVPGVNLFDSEGESTSSVTMTGVAQDGSMTYRMIVQDGDLRTGAASKRRALFAVVDDEEGLIPDSTGFLFFDDRTPTRAGMYFGLELPLPGDDFEARIGKGEAHIIDETRNATTGDVESLTLRFGYSQLVDFTPDAAAP